MKTQTMKKVTLILCLLSSLTFFAQTTITTSLGEFTTLKVFNGIDLKLIQSTENKIVINGEKSDRVKVKNTDKVLKVYLKFPEVSADGKVTIDLYYTNELELIDANEGSLITGDKIEQQKLEVRSQERAFINLVINTKHLTVKSSSGGIVKLTGSTKNQEVDVDLYGIYHGFDLKVTNSSVVRSGTGAKAEVFAGETLNAKVSFGGSIFYKGTPEVIKDKKVVGGIIKQRN